MGREAIYRWPRASAQRALLHQRNERWRDPSLSVTVVLKTMAGEMKQDEHQHQNADHGEENLDS